MESRKIRSTIRASSGKTSRSPVVTVPAFNLDDAIAVAEAAGRLAVLDATAQAAVSLLSEILQEQGVHRALETDVQVRDVALGERDDVHPSEREALEETGRVFLVAAEAVERLGEDHVESPVQRITRQHLKSRAAAWRRTLRGPCTPQRSSSPVRSAYARQTRS